MVHMTGMLEVVVIEGRGLPNLDNSIFNSNEKSDPYCVVDLEGINGSRRIGKTHTIDDCLNPKWNYRLSEKINQDVSGLKFTVKDRDALSSEIIGTSFIDSVLFVNTTHPYTPLLQLKSPKGHPAGMLRMQIQFTGTSVPGKNQSNQFINRMNVKRQDIKYKLENISHLSSKHGKVQPVTFHGLLEIFVEKAVNLPNLDTSILSIKKGDVGDPFIDILVEDDKKSKWKVATTSVIENNLNPVWEQNFEINVCHDVVAIHVEVKDKDVLSADLIGTVIFRAEDLFAKREISGDFELYINGKPRKNALVTLTLRYRTSKELTTSAEVPGCFFQMRELNNVTLYQDAHCIGLPPIIDHFGHEYKQPRAWLDLYNAIIDAREFIYVVGWSVNTKISMLRFENEDNRSIGEILLQKADEGVQVIVMVWNELTSTGLNKEGTMGTSDEATAEFFKDTKVTVIMAARERYTKDISTKQKFTSICYTHHQKCVLLDSAVKGFDTKRQIIAFIGGLDLTDGRFDTPSHPLFDTLMSYHAEDFQNSICLTKAEYGPREPWHDIHCRIEGPAALDLLSNFKQRWDRQGSKKTPHCSLVSKEDDLNKGIRKPDRWNVQIFRSINSDSANFTAKSVGLFVKKERVFDNSIQRAYIHQIRRSNHFIYMENQYFMGSSHQWKTDRESKVENLVPLEIAARIEEKIQQKQRFAAYILVPMFPEGKPADKVIQEILHWQFRTLEMMYSRIANAIKEARIDAHPQDYLLFLCLGKREGLNPNPTPAELTGHGANAFRNRRLMIYVHSKMAIFDDEYVIVGSANINDRSLNGNRDTELAMGAYQPEFMTKGETLADGCVSLFRKSLWLEHMGKKAPNFQNPSDLECVRRVKELAEEGLLSFIDENEDASVRHLLLYPLDVFADGSVKKREDCPTFPDTTASVVGKRSGLIPTRLTS